MGFSLQVASGKLVDLENVNPHEINLHDIAAALSKICRYNGHVDNHYSVAEHSVHLFDYFEREGWDKETQRAAIMHDAPEYLLGDVTTPLKQLLGAAYTRLETSLYTKVAMRFRLSWDIPEIVYDADRRILMNEKAALFSNVCDWGWSVEALPGVEIRAWAWPRAYQEFMRRCAKVGITDDGFQVR